MITLGTKLIELLQAQGVEHVFGIPGVHTIELYRGLAESALQHHTPRHEQGAGFMADGYARVSGKPGVCFIITGPGMTNIATAMGQAYADSIPMLVISSVNPRDALGHMNGMLHEMPDQRAFTAKITRFSHTLGRVTDLPLVLDRAFAVFRSAKPGPVHIEIPTDLLGSSASELSTTQPRNPPAPPCPADRDIETAAQVLRHTNRPLILAGGGARHAAAGIQTLAECLDTPVVMTVNGRGILSHRHPLAVSASPSLKAVRSLVDQSDVVLALGTELGPTDYNMYSTSPFRVDGMLIRCDIDATQLCRNLRSDYCLLGDAALTVNQLMQRLDGNASERGGPNRAGRTMDESRAELPANIRRHVQIIEQIRDAVPNATFVGDSTQLVYAGNLLFGVDAPNHWFNSSTGFGTLGYALPAAIGAAIAIPESPVLCIAGDGGLQFVLGELGAIMDAGVPIIVLVWNNDGYGEIKHHMLNAGVTPTAVDLYTPDFCQLANAYGMAAKRPKQLEEAISCIVQAVDDREPLLLQLDEALMMS